MKNQWKLVWSDEFDRSGRPDPTKWDYEVGMIRNNEKQFYTHDREKNARIENGKLIIEAHKESFENANYTSASLITKGKAGWIGGRFEIRAKLPTGRGTWPAIWTLGENMDEVGWPRCGEIDIMENVGFDPHTILGNVHTAAYHHLDMTHKGGTITIEKPYENFHIYAIEWFDDRIDFFVDDRKYFTFVNESTGDDVWPFDKKQYLILNLAIGGNFGGRLGLDDSIFPQKLEIDYVRIYQKK